ncbi:MAG: hypothetical protein G3H99_07700 [Ferrovum sp.]|jgi:hypothetical protein|nr:hypothetical protein [Ferrovum sp.]NDU87244.1 hypothetical protein [Ferrovum sp.]
MTLNNFLHELHQRPSHPLVFNPWRDHDPLNDASSEAPAQRRSHLSRYLEERLHRARWLLIAEAPGYQGAKFSGCAMTSERRLLETVDSTLPLANPNRGSRTEYTASNPYFSGAKYRTSKTQLSSGKNNPLGSLEPTATMVWNALLNHCHSHDFVLWNAHAWHPHHPQLPLTNRTPTETELELGKSTLQSLIALFPDSRIIAIGRKSQETLASLNISAYPVRHPANGGGGLFRRQIETLISTEPASA